MRASQSEVETWGLAKAQVPDMRWRPSGVRCPWLLLLPRPSPVPARSCLSIKDVGRLGRLHHFLDAVLYADNAPKSTNAVGSRTVRFVFSHQFASSFVPTPF